MDFLLPTVLKDQLKTYDPKQRKVAELEEQFKANAALQEPKPIRFPLGKVERLIPEEIVSLAEQANAVEYINNQPAPHRHYVWTRPVVETPYPLEPSYGPSYVYTDVDDRTQEVYALMYYYESRWIAAWLCGDDHPGLYGVSWTYRNTESTLNKLSSFYFNYEWMIAFSKDNPVVVTTEQTVKRSTFITQALVVTPKMIQSGYVQSWWKAPDLSSYKKKSKNIHRVIECFALTLSTRIPTWESTPLFKRMCTTAEQAWLYALPCSRFLNRNVAIDAGIDVDNWKLDASNVIQLLLKSSYSRSPDYEETCQQSIAMLMTPKLKAWTQEQCNKFVQLFHDPKQRSYQEMMAYCGHLTYLYNHLCLILKVWPDCPVDFIHNNIDLLIQCTSPLSIASDATVQWLRQYMPIKTYFHLLLTNKTECPYQNRIDMRTNLPAYHFSDFYDTIEMLNSIFNAEQTITPPKRWRIHDFHDHVQTIAWTIDNPCIDLPQDLFPTPIKVQRDSQCYTFIQPVNTHQLSQWGRAVRNCIGRVSTYSEGVKKKQHFIVLAMLDNQPKFTMTLDLLEGRLSVAQIVGYANQHLDQEQRSLFKSVFQEALQLRSQQLLPSI